MTQERPLFRAAVAAMAGYVPGEQPKIPSLIKLNTNENPYPPSPRVAEALRAVDPADLRRYPDPAADDLRAAAAQVFGVTPEWVIAGNGSDDILTIAIRSFVDQEGTVATVDPSYSLYPVLAEIQGARSLAVPLRDNFGLPEDLLARIRGADLLCLTRPNAPTGRTYPVDQVAALCRGFSGVVLIDEAYADFAEDDCLGLIAEHENALVVRTLSKSYSLAGLRVGFGVARPGLIEGMMKVKDSYNLDRISQIAGAAALRDQAYLRDALSRVVATRRRTARALEARGFDVVPSETNFLFARPPAGCSAPLLFSSLKDAGILVRYFGGSPRTEAHLRITVGTDEEMDRFVEVLDTIISTQ